MIVVQAGSEIEGVTPVILLQILIVRLFSPVQTLASCQTLASMVPHLTRIFSAHLYTNAISAIADEILPEIADPQFGSMFGEEKPFVSSLIIVYIFDRD